MNFSVGGLSPDHRIAIIGRAGRFPAARNVDEFWSMLAEGRCAAQRLTDAELLAAGVSRKTLSDPNYVRVANILPDMECFDAGFFGFSPREAAILDPQHRHFLECGWEALEDAGHAPEHFAGRIGVFAGSGMQAYLPFNLLTNPELAEETGLFLLRHTGNDKDFLPTRLSYLLNLTGPSVAIQTACSTSLVAIHTAVGSLLNMECDMAIAGGVTIELPHRTGYRFAQGEILSPDGLCRAFDDDSAGTVFGSGAALVVLRRYEDAVADGDDIKAVILGSAINNDGAGKASYLAPSVDGQAEAAAEALAISGLEAGKITYIEAHGTGTPIGDPIELAALRQVYGAAPQGSIGIGSVKTNIGHLDTAAGSAGLIKVVEALRHRSIPPSLNFRKPNSRFEFNSSPFRVVDAKYDWSDGEEPRRAAINSLGVGGTNAHMIVEEAPRRAPAIDADEWRIFPFSARNAEAIDRTRRNWSAFLQDKPPAAQDIAFTLRNGRRAFSTRLAVAARNTRELSSALAAKTTVFRQEGEVQAERPRIVFLFPGGGAQYPGAGAGMLAASPVFAAAVGECFAQLPASAPADLYHVMFDSGLDDTDARAKLATSGYAIPALFILEYAYAKLWESWGVRPDAILAHSVGEYAGAVVSGGLRLADALKIVTLRGEVMDAAPAGAMTAVPLGAAHVRELIGDQLDIAAINTTEATVVSGPVAEIEVLERRLVGGGHEARRVHIDVAAHSRQLDGQLERFRAGFESVVFSELKVPMISSLRGDWAAGDDLLSADYWVRHLRHTVRFADAAAAALEVPNTVVIEIGPGQTLGPLVASAVALHPARAVLASAPKPRDGHDEMGVAVAALAGSWANGFEVDWDRTPGGSKGRRVSLPTYAFEKERHWIEPGKGAGAASDSDEASQLVRIDDPAEWVEVLQWRERARSGPSPDLSGDWLVLAGKDGLSGEVLGKLAAAGALVTTVSPGETFKKTEDGFELRPDSQDDFDALFAAMSTLPKRILSLWGADPDLKSTAFASSYLLTRGIQQADPGPGSRLVFAVSGSASLPGEKGASPELAALLGPVRVAPREIAGLSTALVDVTPENSSAEALLAEAAQADDADHIALRGAKRFVRSRSRQPAPAPESVPDRRRDKGVYLISGGTGAIGRELARWLASTVQASVALLSRSATEDQEFRRQIEEAGGEVMFVAADVTDRQQLENGVDAVKARFGTINGVVHAAGILDDASLSAQALDAALAVTAPKLTGALELHRLMPEGSLDFFAVISSSSVVIGGAGQTAYVGANAGLEALAEARADGLSVAWGAWRDIGMAVRTYGAGEDRTGGHPLLGHRRDLQDGTVCFETVIDPATDWRVAEHVIAGKPVLPGTAYIELANAAAGQVLHATPCEISALSFALPMAFEGLPRRVSVKLRPVADGYDLTIESSAHSDGDSIEHAKAKLVQRKQTDTSLPTCTCKTEDMLTSHLSGNVLQAGVVAFGERWKSVGEIRTGPNEVIGNFALPSAFAEDLESHHLHPALLDMAATVGLATVQPSPGRLFAPMSIGRIRIFGVLPSEVIGYAKKTGGEPGRFASFDVVIRDRDGNPLVVLEDFALREIDSATLAGAVQTPNLTAQLLATGIRRGEAPDLFARVFSHPARHLVVSPVNLDLVRLALAEKAAPAANQGSRRANAVTISDPVAARLAVIWSDILGIVEIEPQDDFFALGGHSLNAVRMFARVRKEFGVALPLASLFETPRLGDLARILGERSGVAEAEPANAPEPVSASTEVHSIEMTEGQREIAAGIVIDPSVSLAYNLSFSLHFTGEIDPDALRKALSELVRRHDILRASFDLENVRLTIHPQAELQFEQSDLSGLAAAEQGRRRDELHDAVCKQPFDLANGKSFRTLFVRFSSERSELMLFVHHIACDGWSMSMLIEELSELYGALRSGRISNLKPAPSIADLVSAESAWRNSDDFDRDRTFWMEKYAGQSPSTDLPTDRPYSATAGTAADRVVTSIDAALEASLRKLAQRAEASLRNVIFAAFRFYLSRMVRSQDIVVGLPSSGQVAQGLEGVAGHAVSLLPIRSRIQPDAPFGSLLKQARQDLLEALDHQSYTHGALVRDLHMRRDPSRHMLAPVVVNIDSLADLGKLAFGGAETRIVVNSTGHEFFELFFNQFDAPGRVELTWNFKTGLFDRSTIALHAENFRAFLKRLASDPAALEKPTLRFLAGDTTRPASGDRDDPGAAGPQTITDVFRATAAGKPDGIAVRYGREKMDYRTLDMRSDALAALLIGQGVRSGDLVGISSQRSLSLMVAVLAVLKAGAGYVPFDVTLPAERLEFMARDTGIRILLGDCPAVSAAGVRTIPPSDFPQKPVRLPEVRITGPSIAYVMFTSGTTGVPKGVVLPHRSVIRMLRDNDWLNLGPDTVTLHSSAFAFDTSIIDIFGALLHGGTVVIPPDGKLSIAALSDAIESYGVNTLWLTSGLFHAVADLRPTAFSKVDQVVVGGDVVSPTHVARVKEVCPELTVINGYGPTESNVTNAHTVIPSDLVTGQPLPIGKAIRGTQIYILDEFSQPVPDGLIGELCIAGRGLALGYWNRPELTAEKFTTAPWDPDLRLYRSGDLALNPGDGALRFFGRADTQVKIRGFRVELTEVESALETHPAVRQAVVVATVPDGQADKVLAAYYIAEGNAPSSSALSGYLAERLPDFARPSFFVQVGEMPINQNGKVDRRRLPAIRCDATCEDAEEAPEGEVEIKLAALWSEVLCVQNVSAKANFFALGGHSLLAVRLFDRIRREFGYDLPISTLFRNQTVRELARLLDHGKVPPAMAEDDPSSEWDTSTVIDPGPEEARRPFFVVGGVGGNVNNLFELGSLLGRKRPVIGFQTRGVQGHTPRSTIEAMAAENIRYMRRHQPEGPYILAGYSGGAYTALEMARQLEAAGEKVERLFALDTYAPGFAKGFEPNIRLSFRQRIQSEVELLRNEGLGYFYGRVKAKMRHTLMRGPLLALMKHSSLSHYRYKMMQDVWMAAAQHYVGGPIGAPITLFRTKPIRLIQRLTLEQDPTLGWGSVAKSAALETPWVKGDHLNMLKGENARSLAAQIEERIEG